MFHCIVKNAVSYDNILCTETLMADGGTPNKSVYISQRSPDIFGKSEILMHWNPSYTQYFKISPLSSFQLIHWILFHMLSNTEYSQWAAKSSAELYTQNSGVWKKKCLCTDYFVLHKGIVDNL
jgi:hypothetical protein